MSITKIAKTKMEITAEYQKLSDLNVAFYNQDINTSILQFNVTRNDAVVPLGKTNVEGYIVLLHEDGSRIQDNLVIENEEHGVIQYTIPREFLKHTGKVLGQVYITVKGRDDTAVMRKISFDIKQDLLTGFSSTKKLEYIKTFDDLQTQIKQRVAAIEEAIANGEDYVAQMIATLDAGKKEIAATVEKANTDINKVATDVTNSVKTTSDTATKGISNTATKATTDITKAVSDGQKNITDTSNTAVATVDGKTTEVLDAIKNNEVVKVTDIANFQKFKITEDYGSSISVISYDLLNTDDIKNFDGYVESVKNVPSGVADRGHLKRAYYSKSITLTYTPYNDNSIYTNVHDFSKKIWFGWEKLVNSSELTKSQPVTIWQGSANGVSSVFYELTRAINTNRKIRVTYNFNGGRGKTSIVDLSSTKILSIQDFNIYDADANGGDLYELQLDFSALNGFNIKVDSTWNVLGGGGKINQKNFTILKIEELN